MDKKLRNAVLLACAAVATALCMPRADACTYRVVCGSDGAREWQCTNYGCFPKLELQPRFWH